MVLVPMVVVVAMAGSRTQLEVALVAAVAALLATINVWGWARCRSWPQVRAVFEHGEPATGRAELQLVYIYADSTYSRPAQTRGAAGESVSLKVNPIDPSLSSLVVPRPDLSIAVLAIASCVLVVVVLDSIVA